MKQALLRLVLAATLLAGPAACAESRYPDAAIVGGEPVSLSVVNASAGTLRCVAVLAHFVTREVGSMAPGEALHMELLREPASGALAYGDNAGKPMMLENLLCGEPARWQASYGDVPLLALRAATGRRFVVRCESRGRLRCTAPADR